VTYLKFIKKMAYLFPDINLNLVPIDFAALLLGYVHLEFDSSHLSLLRAMELFC
jgi:hypothetical protein